MTSSMNHLAKSTALVGTLLATLGSAAGCLVEAKLEEATNDGTTTAAETGADDGGHATSGGDTPSTPDTTTSAGTTSDDASSESGWSGTGAPDACESPCERTQGRLGVSYLGVCGDGPGFSITPSETCQDALDQCLANAEDPDQSIYCEWDGRELYRRETTDGACEARFGAPTCLPSPICELDDPCAATEGRRGFLVAVAGCEPEPLFLYPDAEPTELSCEEAATLCDQVAGDAEPGATTCWWNERTLRAADIPGQDCSSVNPC